MGKKFEKAPGKSYYIISPDEEFERYFGRKADKRRKIYNGKLKCQIYMYFKTEKIDLKNKISRAWLVSSPFAIALFTGLIVKNY